MTFELILIALVITLEPIPLVSFLVIVASRRGVVKGAAFIFGWLLSLAIVIAATCWPPGTSLRSPIRPRRWPRWRSRSLLEWHCLWSPGSTGGGVARRRRRRPPSGRRGSTTCPPSTRPASLSLSSHGAWWRPVSPTSWRPSSRPGRTYLSIIIFSLISVSSMLTIEIYAGFWPERCQRSIVAIRNWIDTHTDQVIIVGSTFLGFWLIGKSTYILVS